MVTILIRRCVRRDKVPEFLENYSREKPNHPDFVSETLTSVRDSDDLPEPMRNLKLASENCVTYINVARWKSVESFIAHFDPFIKREPEIETKDRVRIVLDEI